MLAHDVRAAFSGQGAKRALEDAAPYVPAPLRCCEGPEQSEGGRRRALTRRSIFADLAAATRPLHWEETGKLRGRTRQECPARSDLSGTKAA